MSGKAKQYPGARAASSQGAPPAILVLGPTASGKTDLAVALAERLPCDIISVDSAMVYRGMDIGTAKPDAEVLARAPHRLIDILDPAEAYSAARFRDDALREMRRIAAAGRIPLLVGGTMLYFRALTDGLSPLPERDPEVRRRIDEEARRLGWVALHERLRRLDPRAAERIHPNDPQRLQRALEVCEITGRPMSELIANAGGKPFPYKTLKVALVSGDRERLRARIAQRFDRMLEQGFLDEVDGLFRRGDLGPHLPSIRCVGYRQAWAYLAGELTYDQMVERAVTATRQLAKRQMTWLRGDPPRVQFDPEEPSIVSKVLKLLSANAIK